MVAAEGLEAQVLELGDRGVYVAGVRVELGGELLGGGEERAGVFQEIELAAFDVALDEVDRAGAETREDFRFGDVGNRCGAGWI